MATPQPTSILQEIAQGSFGRVIEQNNRLILIKVDTVKVKNKVLREFVEESLKDGYSYEEIVGMLLLIDESIEKNEVKKALKEFL